jgi:hypothetical protein
MSLQGASRGKLCKGVHILTVQLGDMPIGLDTGWSDGFCQYRMSSLNFTQNKLDIIYRWEREEKYEL